MAQDGPNWEKFGMQIMRAWPEGGIDGFELQELAEVNNIILPIEGGYDPEKHNDQFGFAETGDPWFERNYTVV